MNFPDSYWPEERASLQAWAPARPKNTEALRRLDFCRDFDNATLQNLAPCFTLHTFTPRAVIYRAGDERDAVYGIAQGHVKILREEHGRRTLLDVLPPGTIFGEDALYSGGRRDRTATAYDRAMLLRITKGDFQRLLSEHPSLYDYLFHLIGERLARAEDKVVNLSLDGIARRLAKLLVELAARYGTDQEGGRVLINLKLPHRELADLVGSTRESVTTHLSDLRRQRLIEITDRRIIINDLASLSSQA
jgi:CRP/FNR family transcriptional regulator